MNKNVFIALLIGVVIGQFSLAHAENQTSNSVFTNGITRHDVMEAAALVGILANNRHDPLGWKRYFVARSPKDYRAAAKEYADSMQ